MFERIFPGDSELASRMRALDWSKTDLGDPASWPDNLRIALSICVTSRFPMQVWWGPDYTMLYNDAYIPFLGRDSADGSTRGKHPHALGRSAREIWAELWHQIGPMLETARTKGIASWSEDIQMFFDRKIPISQGGEEVYVSFSFSPIFEIGGGIPGTDQVEGIFCACIEVSEKVFLAKELKAALDETIKASRMKDEFLATLSHELRTPMSAILGWTQVLRLQTHAHGEHALTPQALQQGLEVIDRNARLQSQIIEDLLDMNRILSGKMRLEVQSVPIGKVVETAIDSVRPAAEAKGVHLQSTCEPHLQDIRGDAARLQQVIYNLLSNAVKFTPKDGSVQVVCRRVGAHIEFTVSDTGKGITAEFIPFIFERFRQQDASITRTFGGLGLGLSIVKEIVELHGGTVQAVSEGDGKGATFTVHIPIAVAIIPAPPAGALDGELPKVSRRIQGPPALEAIDTSTLRGKTILVIDDERDARELISKVLEERGAVCLLASSADEALKHFHFGTRPDLMVSDLGMPGMNGYDLMARVRQLPPDRGGATPSIALTAYARPEDRSRSLLAGFQLHLSKPVDITELLASILSLID